MPPVDGPVEKTLEEIASDMEKLAIEQDVRGDGGLAAEVRVLRRKLLATITGDPLPKGD